jgi:hypothetical protein
LGLFQLWGFITLSENLWLKWSPNQSCSLCWEFSNGISHITCTWGNQGDYGLLMVKSLISQTDSSTPFISGKCSSFATNLMILKFWENIVHLLNWNWLKFEINPKVNLKRTIILNKNPKACSRKSFHELHYNYLLHTTSFHALFLHTFFPCVTFFHT